MTCHLRRAASRDQVVATSLDRLRQPLVRYSPLSRPRSSPARERLDGGAQVTLLGEHGRWRSTGELDGVRRARARAPRRRLRGHPHGVRIGVEPLRHEAKRQGQCDQALSRAVVGVSLEPAAFDLAGRDDPRSRRGEFVEPRTAARRSDGGPGRCVSAPWCRAGASQARHVERPTRNSTEGVPYRASRSSWS